VREVRRVGILGAGAIGAFFVERFSGVAGLSTMVVARGERYDRLKRLGLVVNGKAYAPPVVHPEEARSPADLILVALKHHHLPDGIQDIARLVGDDTTIVSAMNGLDSEEIIGSVYGADKVLYGITVGIDAVRQENRITYTTEGKLFFGEADNTQPSPRVRQVQAALDRAGIVYEIPADMIRILWWKFMINVGMNPASAVLRAPYGTFQTSRDAQALMEALMREVLVLAEPAGVKLEEKDIEDWYKVLHTLSPQGKTSMLQDVEAGRKTEVEMLAGKAVELGQRYGIPTPVNQTVLHTIRVMEQGLGIEE
jgi:2-dehydropantoate 2-reductase